MVNVFGQSTKRGPPGPPGVQGPPGKTGRKGDAGTKGDIGSKGEPGVKGDTGDAGQKGDTGSKGQPGERGPPGGLSIVFFTKTILEALRQSMSLSYFFKTKTSGFIMEGNKATGIKNQIDHK